MIHWPWHILKSIHLRLQASDSPSQKNTSIVVFFGDVWVYALSCMSPVAGQDLLKYLQQQVILPKMVARPDILTLTEDLLAPKSHVLILPIP